MTALQHYTQVTLKGAIVGEAFNDFVLESVDEALRDLFCKDVRCEFYLHMERREFCVREEIPFKLDRFLSCLRQTFGSISGTIERAIAKRLYVRVGLQFSDFPKWDLEEYVKYARRHLDSKRLPALLICSPVSVPKSDSAIVNQPSQDCGSVLLVTVG